MWEEARITENKLEQTDEEHADMQKGTAIKPWPFLLLGENVKYTHIKNI